MLLLKNQYYDCFSGLFNDCVIIYEGRTVGREQLCFACELGRTDEGECGGRWNQLLCYP